MTEPLTTSTIRHQVYLERLKSHEVNQFAAFLRQMDQRLRQRLESSTPLTDFSRARLERLLASIERALQAIFDNYYEELAGHLTDLALYEAEFESRNLNAALANVETAIPAANQVRIAVFSAPLSVRGSDGGKLLEPFVRDWQANEIKRVTGAIRQGAFEGQTNAEIVRRLRGSKANQYRDGLLSITNRNAQSVVRTAVQHVASEARFQTWETNRRVVKGYRWVATLDSRTTQQCRSLDGQTFVLGKGPKPPVHVGCRSTTVAELDQRFQFLKEGATRSSKDGYVSAELTYYDWLKQQTPEFQNDALGPSRAKLFRDGGLTPKRFADLNLGRHFQPMTLAEMRKQEPEAFAQANL